VALEALSPIPQEEPEGGGLAGAAVGMHAGDSDVVVVAVVL
jgi:hypothetical protein